MSYAAEKIAERRKAVDMLRTRSRSYLKRYKYSEGEALCRACRDVESALRQHAQELIDESTTMWLVHESRPAVRAAA